MYYSTMKSSSSSSVDTSETNFRQNGHFRIRDWEPTPDYNIIQTLVKRILSRLTTISKPADTVKDDPIVQQAVSAIVNLARYRIEGIAKTLVEALNDLANLHGKDENFSIHRSRPQLFLVRLLGACFYEYWEHSCKHRIITDDIASEVSSIQA
ncbi:hypothetical protein BX666DRAFT_2145024, partial [Dichotomocladium elegans]